VRTSIRQAAIYDEYVAYLRDEHGSDLVSHWPLDERPGATTATDVISGYDGTHNGGVSPGYGGVVRGLETATRYDGSTGYTDAGDQSALDTGASDDLTILVWLRAVDSGVPVSKWNGGSGPLLTIFLDGDVRLRLEDGQGDTEQAFQSNLIDFDGDRHLIGGVVDRSDDQARLYLDGERSADVGISSINDMSTTAPLNIGRRGDGRAHIGSPLQHVSWLDAALTDNEIADLYERGREGGL